MMARKNAARLREGLEEALADIRGEETAIRATPIAVTGPDVRAVRTKLGISQDRMASLLGTSTSGYRKWEQGQRRPSGAALTLLRIADHEPEAVLRVLRDR